MFGVNIDSRFIFFIVLIVVIILLILIVLHGKRQKIKNIPEFTGRNSVEHDPKDANALSELPYLLRASFLSSREISFFCALLPIVQKQGWHVAIKPRLIDFIYVNLKRYEKGSQYQSYLNKIISKHIDFLICDFPSLKPLLALELDDRSHLKPSRADRDFFVDRVYEKVGLPILHIWDYSPESLEARIVDVLGISPMSITTEPLPKASEQSRNE